MPDFQFLGSIAHFWKLIIAEHQRLKASFGCEPFKFEILGRNTHPLVEYVPVPGEVIALTFFNADFTDNVLVVEAEHKTEETILEIMLFPQHNAFEENNKPGFAKWNDIRNTLLVAGHLIDTRAQILAAHMVKAVQLDKKITLPPEPPLGSDAMTWLDWRFEILKQQGQTYTLKQLAPKIPVSPARLRTIHGLYKIKRELPNRYETQYKTQYKKRYKN